MRCHICGHGELVETEYKSGEITAPALTCKRCGAITLDERVAKSEQDLDSIRCALAARMAAGTSVDLAMRRTPPASISVGLVDSALSGIDLLLAHARVALDFLAESTESESGKKTVADLQRIVGRIGAVIDDLGHRCAGEVSKDGGVAIHEELPKRGLAS